MLQTLTRRMSKKTQYTQKELMKTKKTRYMNRLSDYFEMIITVGIKEIEFHDAYERFMLIEKVTC